jgi:hypothetical protein
MSHSRIDTLANVIHLAPYIDSFNFNRMEPVRDVGDMSFSTQYFASSRYDTLSIIFPSFQESLRFMFSDFTDSEIKMIDSSLQFYLRLFPYEPLLDAMKDLVTTVSMHKRDDSFLMKFKCFSIAYRYNEWIFQINDKFNKNRCMLAMSYDELHMAILSAFDAMFKDIFMTHSLIVNNNIVKAVAANQTNFAFSSMRYNHTFTHESDMDFAMHIKKYNKFRVFEDRISNEHVFNKDELCIIGNFTVEKNIMSVAKLSETQITIHNESVHLLDHLFKVALRPSELNYLKKILELMRLSDSCYPNQKDTKINIVRSNNSKKTIFNLITERCPFTLRTGRHTITIGAYISVGIYIEDEYTSLKLPSFEAAYEVCYDKFITHVSKTLDIKPEDVTDLHFKTLEMSNY